MSSSDRPERIRAKAIFDHSFNLNDPSIIQIERISQFGMHEQTDLMELCTLHYIVGNCLVATEHDTFAADCSRMFGIYGFR